MKKLVLALGILIAATATAAMADDGGFGIGAGIVKVKTEDTSHLWLTANLRLMMAANLALEPEIGWFRETAGDDHVDVFNGGGSLLFIIPSHQVNVFAGAGLGAHMYRSSVSGSSSSETHLGYHGLAGLDLKASEGVSLFGAVRYEIVDAEVNTAGDKLKQWKVYGGLRFRSH
jgi:hypothetical protein